MQDPQTTSDQLEPGSNATYDPNISPEIIAKVQLFFRDGGDEHFIETWRSQLDADEALRSHLLELIKEAEQSTNGPAVERATRLRYALLKPYYSSK